MFNWCRNYVTDVSQKVSRIPFISKTSVSWCTKRLSTWPMSVSTLIDLASVISLNINHCACNTSIHAIVDGDITPTEILHNDLK